MNKKYWINNNFESIQKAFNSFVKHTETKFVWTNIPYFKSTLSNEIFKHVYLAREEMHSSWSDSVTVDETNYFDQEKYLSLINFIISLMVPRLKKNHIKKISKNIIKNAKTNFDGYKCFHYETYEYHHKAIKFSKFIYEIELYLKENNIFRLKEEFSKNN